MKKLWSRLFALLLLLAILLPVCVCADGEIVPYAKMEYERPDLEQMQSLLDEVCTLAEGRNANAILDGVFRFYDAYDWFYTCCSLADIRYSADLTDPYWKAENSFCTAGIAQVEQMLDSLNAALAASPSRRQLERDFFGRGFFQSYDDGSVWDDTLVVLMERESELISQYYDQSGESTNFFASFFFRGTDKIAQTLVDLILVRNEIAAYCGYDSYEAFAGEYYYYRDYTPGQMDAYLHEIREKLVPLYRRIWKLSTDLPKTDEKATFAFVRDTASRMGGSIWDAFCLMEEAELYDIAPGRNKYNSSFEVFLETYGEPFVFMNPDQTMLDYLTFAHEFGHFCNDYASGGSAAGIDVCEIFSQGMEYLALCYGADTQELTRAKLSDSLCTFVEQACYASFEREMYRLPEPSVQALYDLYEQTALAFGFDAVGFESSEFTGVTHFYTNPMYVTSYIISNDAALQLYQLELENAGAGLACFQKNLDTEEPYFMAFLKEAGLDSPFAPGRVAQIRQTFETVFGE